MQTITGMRGGSGGLAATLIRAVVGSAGIRVLGIGLTFLVGVQLARGFGPQGYGTYALALSVIALLTVPIEFGVPQLLTREVAAAHARRDWPRLFDVLSWADRIVIVASIGMAVSMAIALALLRHRISDDLSSVLIWGCALLPLVALGHLRGASLRGLQHIVLGQLSEVLLRPLLFAFALFAIFRWHPQAGVATAMALNAVTAGVAFILASHWLRSRLPQRATSFRSTTNRRGWLASAFPMALTEGMRMLQGHIATLLLGVFATVVAVGLFRVASSTAVVVAMPITLMNVVAAPIVARLFSVRDLQRLQRLASTVALAMFAGVAGLSLPLFIGGDTLLAAVFGEEYRPARNALLLLCAGQLAGAVFGAAATYLNMCGHERRVTRAFGISLAVNLVAAVALIPNFGDMGAAGANVLGLLSWNSLMWLDVRRILRIDTSIFPIRVAGSDREVP